MSFWEDVAKKKQMPSRMTSNDKEVSDINKENDSYKVTDVTSVNDSNDIILETKSHNNLNLDLADVVIITAVETEYQLACKVFGTKATPFFFDGFKYSLVRYNVNEEKIVTIAILMQKNMGLVSAAIAATYAIKTSNPQLLLMCGVCAGVEKRTSIGDLIVFSPVYDYGAGKYNGGNFFPDYRQRSLNGEIKQIVDKMSSDKDLCRRIKDSWGYEIGKPETELRIHIQPSGAGAAVITDEEVVAVLRNHQRTLVGIDMESFAIAEASYESGLKEVPWLVVKGVQDFASPLKNDTFREYAAHASAFFLKEFICEYFG